MYVCMYVCMYVVNYICNYIGMSLIGWKDQPQLLESEPMNDSLA